MRPITRPRPGSWPRPAQRRGLAAARCLAIASALMAWPALAQQDPVQAGFRLMADRTGGNCIACHALPGQPGVQSSFGPPLNTVGARYDAATLRQWVTDARQIKPDTLMPPFGTTQGTRQATRAAAMLTDDEITQVVAALQTLR